MGQREEIKRDAGEDGVPATKEGKEGGLKRRGGMAAATDTPRVVKSIPWF